HFIINPQACSGKGIKTWLTVKSQLDQQNIDYEAYFTKHNMHAAEIARELTEYSLDIKKIIVLGGDGTLNEVINGVLDFSKIFLGYIPSGSSNDFARSLKIPRDPLAALSNILKPNHFTSLDYGNIQFLNTKKQDRRFACSSGLGFDANVTKEALNSNIKDVFNRFGLGKLTYLVIALKQIILGNFFDATITANGITKDYHNIFLISNMIHKYEGGGLAMAPKASPIDGKLDICLVHGLSKIKILFLIPTLLFGKHIGFKGVEYFKCPDIHIKTSSHINYHTDGESEDSSLELKVSCIASSLNMIL
ncbi:MAG TPA: diacylglycerol kinase family lipid kinase, partial [Clostridiales bacterium]|nr:diacylglycerol kinase family lipid kinase [Clostridiales bacterium]